jgi:hypothetical protein
VPPLSAASTGAVVLVNGFPEAPAATQFPVLAQATEYITTSGL